jgi:hypothetical protein
MAIAGGALKQLATITGTPSITRPSWPLNLPVPATTNSDSEQRDHTVRMLLGLAGRSRPTPVAKLPNSTDALDGLDAGGGDEVPAHAGRPRRSHAKVLETLVYFESVNLARYSSPSLSLI